MQQAQKYGQSRSSVNAHRHGGQTYRVNVRIGQERVRIIGNHATIMDWVRLALAEREAHA